MALYLQELVHIFSRYGVTISRTTSTYTRSHIQVCDFQRVLLDELAARFHLVAHERGEHVVGAAGVVDLHFQQATGLHVHGGLPELLRIHLAKALVALYPLAA